MTSGLIRARRAITPDGERPLSVEFADGRITGIGTFDAPGPGGRTLADDEVLLPGLVDSHVHINDPGRTDWEGFPSATAAAAAGGVTTLLDMPLNSIPPTCDVASLDAKIAAARGRVAVDVGFWGGAVPGNVAQLRPLNDAGVYGFKCFLSPSGVDEFPSVDEQQLGRAMREIATFDGLLLVHAEDPALLHDAPAGRAYAGFVHSRPPASEVSAIDRVIRLAGQTGCRVHIVHLSSAEALPAIAAARADGVRLTVETCPHYLCLTAEEVPDGATQYKCCPPIRGAANRDQLWSGLAAGIIDCVVSDHSPSTADLKRLDIGDFAAAWGGIASLQLGLAAIWTEARPRGFGLVDIVRWMATGPAAMAGLPGKGSLTVGAAADFAVVAPERTFVVDPARLAHKNPITPYAARTLTGVVRETWLGGEPITAATRGRLLRKGGA